MAHSAIAVYVGKRRTAVGASVLVAPGRYTEISSVTYQVPVATTVQTAIVTPTLVPVQTTVTTPGTFESLYEPATCTTTSWSSLDHETNFDDNTADITGSSTANCTSAAFPGVVEQDFEFWGWNDHDNIPTPAPSAAFMGAVGATYTAQVFFVGDGPATTSNITTYVTQDVTSFVTSVRQSRSRPITLTTRRPLLVVR